MLIDFGIARWVKQEEKGVTAVGTMGYAPPELFAGRVEPRSDIYSLGATMFHLLTGSDPQDNPLLIFDFAKNPRPRQITPSLSSEIEQILMRAVEYKPEDRFGPAGEMRDALATHLKGCWPVELAMECPLRNWAARPFKSKPFTAVSAADGSPPTMFSVRTAERDNHWREWARARPCVLRVRLQNWSWPGTTELDASFILQKDNNLVGRTDPHSNIFPEIDLSNSIPRLKFRVATRAFGWKGKLFWSKISVR